MSFLIDNVCSSVRVSLTLLRKSGFWQSSNLDTHQKISYYFYGFLVYMLVLGSFIIAQVIDLFIIWGNIPLMTADAFLLLTNVVQTLKIINLMLRRKTILDIIERNDQALREANSEKESKVMVNSCDKLTSAQMCIHVLGPFFNLIGFIASSTKRQLPVRTWYPYDSSVSPAYEVTYMHQVLSLAVGATLNVCKDSLATTLIAQCRCRFQVLGLSLRTLCRDLKTNWLPLTPEQEKIVSVRLRHCIQHHQDVLEEVLRLENCFSILIFAQFTASLVIICVTEFQIIASTDHPVRLLSMVIYLLSMILQVFIYCFHGNYLTMESSKIADYAYECPWYLFPVHLRRQILIIMTRARRFSIISVAGLTTLSLASFASIIKASYSLLTLLQNVDAKE